MAHAEDLKSTKFTLKVFSPKKQQHFFLAMLGRQAVLPCFFLLPFVWATSVMELRASFYLDVEETQTELKKKTGAILYQSDLMVNS